MTCPRLLGDLEVLSRTVGGLPEWRGTAVTRVTLERPSSCDAHHCVWVEDEFCAAEGLGGLSAARARRKATGVTHAAVAAVHKIYC